MNDKSRFAQEHEEELLDNYKPISALSIVALIFGVLGALTATKSFFMFLSILAIVLAVLAILRMSLSRQEMVGWTAAYLALGLGIFFCVSRVSYEQFRIQQISKDSVPIATDWLGYVSKGKMYQAHQLTLDYYDREFAGANLVKLYALYPRIKSDMTSSEIEMSKESSKRGQYEKFCSEDPMKTIIEHAKKEETEFKFVRNVKHFRLKLKEDLVVQEWRMKYLLDGKPTVLEFRIRVRRVDLGMYFGAHWYIERVYPPEEDAFG